MCIMAEKRLSTLRLGLSYRRFRWSCPECLPAPGHPSRKADHLNTHKTQNQTGCALLLGWRPNPIAGPLLGPRNALPTSPLPHPTSPRTGQVLLLLLLFKKILSLNRGEGRKRGRETSVCGCLSCAPYWGPGPQPRRVP